MRNRTQTRGRQQAPATRTEQRPSQPRRPPRARRRPRRFDKRRSRTSFLPSLSITRIQTFIVFLLLWLKHRLRLFAVGPQKTSAGDSRRERVYVDASFIAGQNGEDGLCGIGIWLPRRSVAIALKVSAKTSMEGEIMALLAGTIAAEQFKVERPVIFSDCKSAVQTVNRLMQLDRKEKLSEQVAHLARLSASHSAYGRVFDMLCEMDGVLQWQPREENREADLASNIGSRVGNMGILLASAKNRNHALNDVLSLALDPGGIGAEESAKPVHRRYRSGTRTISFAMRRPPTGRTFHRKAYSLIARLAQQAEVA